MSHKATAFLMTGLLFAVLIRPAMSADSAKVNEELPAGDMQKKATTACTECHEARIIVQQRLNKAAWTKEVDKMIKWGAVVDAADHDALIDYFNANFSPEREAYQAPRTSQGKPQKTSAPTK